MHILKKLQELILTQIDSDRFVVGRNEYLIRKAEIGDIEFITDTIIAAEKSNSNKLGLALLFGLQEDHVRLLIINMLKEEIDGCEYSMNNYLVVENEENVVAAIAGWIENYDDTMPSEFYKSNLISYTFPKENFKILAEKSEMLKNLSIGREKNCLQLEYLFVNKNHRTRLLELKLIERHINNSLQVFPSLPKVQIQVFSNNKNAIRLYEKIGFTVVKKYTTSKNILTYLPCNEKLLLERPL